MDGGHAHNHELAPAEEFAGRDTARLLRLVTIGCAIVVILSAALLWPSGRRTTDPLGLQADPIAAHVTAVEELPCAFNAQELCAVVSIELTGGGQAGSTASFEQSLTTTIRAGDDITVTAAELGDDDGTAYSFFDFERSTPLIVLMLLFVGAVVALGRWRGVGALAGLAVSLIVIIWFALPSLADGNNAVAVALVTASAVAMVALYLAHGVGSATDVALLSTLASLALTGILAWAFVGLANFTGLNDDAAFVLQTLGTGIDPRGILLAGIVIGSLGVLDDVTVTQVSAVSALHHNRPDLSKRELFTSALTIGRDHISSTVNTLFLAYVGAALPLLLLFSGLGESVSGVATREVVATEIVRALVGSIGLVASVPISTALAVRVVGSAPGRGRSEHPNRSRTPRH
ncbi:MAG: YibE/F family protein [Ilumatobacteraceae bacterium]